MRSIMETVEFYGQKVLVSLDALGQEWVAVKPVCEAIGVLPESQAVKLKADPQFNCVDIHAVGADGKNRKMFCLPLAQLGPWLLSINSNKIKPEARQKLLLFQKELHGVIDCYLRKRKGSAEEFTGLASALHEVLRPQLASIREDMQRGFDSVQSKVEEDMRRGFDSVQAEVDELRELIHVTISDSDEKEIRELIRRVKKETATDGRAIVGRVRKTLGIAGVYNTPNLLQVKNVLRNMLGSGVLGLVEQPTANS